MSNGWCYQGGETAKGPMPFGLVAEEIPAKPPPAKPPPAPAEPDGGSVPAGRAAIRKGFWEDRRRIGPSGLGGCLAVVGVGQVMAVPATIISILEYYSVGAIADVVFENIFTIFLCMLTDAAVITIISISVVLLLNRAKYFPRMFVAQFPLTVIAETVDGVVLSAGGVGPDDMEFVIGRVATTIVLAAICVPYMLTSKRVANTFVR